jgi:LPS O-antigen subunit length determinant protein (WzzB/FepE family)
VYEFEQHSQLHQHLPSDEIDLFELFHAIWKQKRLVIGCTILAGLLGVGYAVLAPRVYQVSSVLRPAAINELDALNRSEVYKLPPADALAKVGAQLESYEARLGFFRANPALFERSSAQAKAWSRALKHSIATR